MPQYTKKELDKLQSHSLIIAKYFVDFCKKHDLLCFFCGGGCIGSIRHKGFVPWDDDLDFFMPRDDYNKLISLWKKEADNKRFKMSLSSENYVDRNLFVTIRDTKTTVVKPYQKDLDIPHGLALDVLPLDGYPNRKIQRKFQIIWASVYSLFCAQTVPDKHGGIMQLGSKILLGIFRGKSIRYKIWKYCEKKMTQYSIEDCVAITELCAGPGYMRNRYPKEIFESAIFVDFEDEKMPIPVGYDCYLQIAFGDYMQLPPLEKRIAHHDAIFIDLENGYNKYKGVYYCLQNTEEDYEKCD